MQRTDMDRAKERSIRLDYPVHLPTACWRK